MTEGEAREQARTFVADCLAFLRHLLGDDQQPRIFPLVVRVDSIGFDRWGRRTIRGWSDEQREEVLFTDDELRPGEIYFMHPLSNPLRVEPILVPAGDLLNPRAGKKAVGPADD